MLRLVVGLGNPGDRYARTRHNVGFRVIERLAEEEGIRVRRVECSALTGRGLIAEEPVLLAKPQTFMNASGEAVQALCQKYDVDLERMCVVCNDVNLPLGQLRFRRAGSFGGHKGLKSMVERLGTTSFARLRVGIRGETYSRERDLADYVLEPFGRAERPLVEEAVERAAQGIRRWITSGIDVAMQWTNAVPG